MVKWKFGLDFRPHRFCVTLISKRGKNLKVPLIGLSLTQIWWRSVHLNPTYVERLDLADDCCLIVRIRQHPAHSTVIWHSDLRGAANTWTKFFAAAGPRLWNSLPVQLCQTSPTDCSDDRWKDVFSGKHEHGALWLSGALEKHLLTYLLTYPNLFELFLSYRPTRRFWRGLWLLGISGYG